MIIEELFSKYATEARKADYLFHTIQEKYPLSVKCRIRCSDCCYAVFGVFPIEAAYINYHFNRLERRVKRDVLRRAEKAETEIIRAKDKLEEVFEDKPDMRVYGLGKERIRCPFLTDKKECLLYDRRPIICRIYGVPYSLNKGKKEKSYVCCLSGFEENVTYPAVKLDKIYSSLCRLSREMLTKAGSTHPEKADYMLPLSRVLRMPFEKIVTGDFEE